MKQSIQPDIGRIVLSKAGRDKGRYFVIYQVVDEQYVLLLDGSLRKLDSPKRKKIKHLELKPDIITPLHDKFLLGKRVFDSEIRSALDASGYNTKTNQRKEA